MSRVERTQEIDRLKDELGQVRNAILIDYRGITVPQVTELRAEIRKQGGRYAVVKNTLLKRAVAGGPLEALGSHMEGPTAIAWHEREPVAVAKTLSGFLRVVKAIQVKAVLLDGVALPGSELESIASLPTREELRGMVVQVLASPLRRLATVLAGPSRGLVTVLARQAEK